MTLLKRTFSSLYAKIDLLVGEIENHDALIQAAIVEQKKKISAAKVQSRRLKNSEQALREQIAQLSINERRWTQRAVKEASRNEAQALACLQRRQDNRSQLVKLNQMRDEYQQSIRRMSENITQCEEDLNAMIQKHEMLRARQSTAEAMQLIDQQGNLILGEVENSFDRWEIKISQGETLVDPAIDVDELEQEYLSEENELQLRSELAELLKENKIQGGDQ
ncbi:hypothetical protein NBRC116493_12140 [Aurantivibrio infirmus]